MTTFLRDTWIIFNRSMRLSLRNPIWVVLGLIQPILYLALFGPLLKQVVSSTPGLPPGDAWQIFVPGLLVQLGIFGGLFVGFGIIAEWRSGVIERQLDGKNIELAAVEVRRPTLDDVFLSLTGRSLRDGDA